MSTLSVPRPPAGADPFAQVERITAVGVLIGALEDLVSRTSFDDRGTFAWPVHRSAIPTIDSAPMRALDRALAYPTVLALPLLRALIAGRLLTGRPGHTERAVLLSTLTATAAVQHLRHNTGRDGSDHISFINMAVSALANMFAGDPRAREICAQFLAFQSCVSYATSGAVKVVSPTWLSGRAATGVFRTECYGDRDMYRFLKLHPLLPKLMSWGVIAGELVFPAVMVAPKPLARAMLAAGVGFHLANGRFMGLNRFLWGFCGTYPAVAHVSRALGGRS